MGCNNCGQGNRHKQKIPLVRESVATNDGIKTVSVPQRDLDRTPSNPLKMKEAATPEEAFEVARSLSYDEILQMTHSQQEAIDKNSEAALSNMTVAMKRFHVVSLLGIYNLDLTTMTGISPYQALVGLNKVLRREDFKCVRDMYPDLQDKVAERVEALMQHRIIID